MAQEPAQQIAEAADTEAMRAKLLQQGRLARQAARQLATLSTEVKDGALRAIADALITRREDILRANERDVAEAKVQGVQGALIDRLTLNDRRIADMAEGLRALATLPDPVGRGLARWQQPNGLEISQVRVPLGVVGMIYEARPNVTVDAAGLCLKSGNAVLLRGSREALHSNRMIAEVIAEAAVAYGMPEGSVQLVDGVDRESALQLMRLHEYLDVLIPRGGAGLIRAVVENATVPIIETGLGVCHTYIDEGAEPEEALAIAINAKCHRPGVCNAMETLLVHSALAASWLPRLAEAMRERGVELRGCERARSFVLTMQPASEDDWSSEYLDTILAVRVVDSLDEALDHIDRYGTRHSEAIVTRDYERARRFQQEVDAAAVYVNASTRFTDGFQFGFGAEIGISTQKLHARGPMGLEALTTTKFLVSGSGHVRE